MKNVRPVTPDDAATWLALRRALWPDDPESDHREEIARFLEGRWTRPSAAWMAEDDEGRVVGFAEASIRQYAEGCRTDRVGYLEGWYVRAEARGRGVGSALVAACEAWARAAGCVELASDAEGDNEVSASAHSALGFEDLGLVRLFRKDLS